MIVNFNLKGVSTKKDEILGKFSKGGFASKVNYIDHLKDLNRIKGKVYRFFTMLLKGEIGRDNY